MSFEDLVIQLRSPELGESNQAFAFVELVSFLAECIIKFCRSRENWGGGGLYLVCKT